MLTAYRYTVKELLQLDFFLEDCGIKVELVNKDSDGGASSAGGGTDGASGATTPAGATGNTGVIQLRLRVLDTKKRKPQHKENEAIQFDYNIDKDNPDEVAQEMVSHDLLATEIQRKEVVLPCTMGTIIS